MLLSRGKHRSGFVEVTFLELSQFFQGVDDGTISL
jgi:hypothetical protein